MDKDSGELGDAAADHGRRSAMRHGAVRAANEALILEAAEALFGEVGFKGATMQAIADRAGLPKANVHYYFGSKMALYTAVLDNILTLWLEEADTITPDADPAAALGAYIEAKVAYSRDRPAASRVFANEVISGAPALRDHLRTTLRRRVEQKARVIRGWIAQGRMAEVDPTHLFFMIWACSQTYADFAVQVAAVLGREQVEDEDFAVAADMLKRVILGGCGLAPAAGTAGMAGTNTSDQGGDPNG